MNTQQEVPVPEPARGHDVFVSYSRADRGAIVALTRALAERGKRAWVDLEDIPPSAEWMAEIRAAIEAADGYLVAVSPDLARSKVCEEELEHARAAGKRVVPVLVRPTESRSVPQALAALNWIDATEGPSATVIDAIVRALETDLEHVRAHTRLLVRASEWATRGEPNSLLLRADDLKAAETLLVAAQGREPAPTAVQARYVQASRNGAAHRQRAVVAAVSVALVVSLVLAAVAVIQRGEAIEQRRAAERQAALADSRALAAEALTSLEEDLALGSLLAIEAVRVAATPQAERALHVAAQRTAWVDRIIHVGAGATKVIAVHPDGRQLVSAGRDALVGTWDAETGAPVADLVGHVGTGFEGRVFSLAYSPDGAMVASGGGDGQIVLSDPDTGEQLGVPLEMDSAVRSLAFSPDGEALFAGSEGGRLVRWDPDAGVLIEDAVDLGAGVSALAFGRDEGLLVVALRDGRITLRDTAPGFEVVRSLGRVRPGPNGVPVAFSPGGRSFAAGSGDGTVSLWDATTWRRLGEPIEVHSSEVAGVAFSPDGRLVASGSFDGEVALTRVDALRLIAEPIALGHAVETVGFDPASGALAVATDAGQIVLLDGSLGRLVEHTEWVLSVSVSRDAGVLASAGVDGTVLLWDPADRRPVGRPFVHEGGAYVVSVRPDGRRLALATADGVVVWDVASRSQLGLLRGADADTQYSVAYSPDGRLLVSGGEGGGITIWDAGTLGAQADPLRGNESAVLGVAFSPDGRQLASAGADGTVRVWDTTTWQPIPEPVAGAESVWWVTYSPDGRLLASGSEDGTVRTWDPTTGTEVGEPMEQAGWVFGVSFSPDGDVIAAATTAGTVVLWDVETRQQIGEPLQGHAGPVDAVAFAPDGSWLASSSDDGTIALWEPWTWDPNSSSVADHLCAIVGRDLTAEEWARFLPFASPRPTCSR
jgi:WD40 repeat protein